MYEMIVTMHALLALGLAPRVSRPIWRQPNRFTSYTLFAREVFHIQRSELVDLKCGDATQVVADMPGPFDCVFFDADRYSAPAQLALLIPKLAPDVLLLADNVLSHPDEIAGYLQALESLSQFERVILPTGKGLSVAYRSNGSKESTITAEA